MLLLILLAASTALADDTAKKLLALVDYIGSDYRHAVRAGKILKQDEYNEQLEFSKRTLELLDQLKGSGEGDKARIEPDIKALVDHVNQKADPAVVATAAARIEAKLTAAYSIVPYPRQLPLLQEGQKLFTENCATCHGAAGKGDGPSRATMTPKEPPPANFTDHEFMGGISPFKAFNAISFGVQNTAMASFEALPEDQRWQLAFYVLSLRFSQDQAAQGESLVQAKPLPAELTSAETLATLSNDQLTEKLKGRFDSDAQTTAALAYLRRGILEKQRPDPLRTASALLLEATELYAAGSKDAAYQKAVEAYLDGLELAEPTLFSKDMAFGRSLESQFMEFRNAIKQGVPAGEVRKRYNDIAANLDQAAEILARPDSFPGYYTFSNSALIILREGLEAALILAAILAMLKVMGATDAIRYIHLGWILALAAGFLTWIVTQTILTFSGRHRESMEGFISIFAAVALFYVGYWLHTRTEAQKWQAFIKDKVQNSLSTNRLFGLVGISFFAVYREAFEVVLFYQALWLQSENSHASVIWGFVAGLVILIFTTLAIFKLGLRIPLKYFFGVTGTLLYIVAFVFAGNGIKELQAAGWLPSTPIGFPPQVPVLGIYPTLETLGAQLLMLLAFFLTTRNRWHRTSSKKIAPNHVAH